MKHYSYNPASVPLSYWTPLWIITYVQFVTDAQVPASQYIEILLSWQSVFLRVTLSYSLYLKVFFFFTISEALSKLKKKYTTLDLEFKGARNLQL